MRENNHVTTVLNVDSGQQQKVEVTYHTGLASLAAIYQTVLSPYETANSCRYIQKRQTATDKFPGWTQEPAMAPTALTTPTHYTFTCFRNGRHGCSDALAPAVVPRGHSQPHINGNGHPFVARPAIMLSSKTLDEGCLSRLYVTQAVGATTWDATFVRTHTHDIGDTQTPLLPLSPECKLRVQTYLITTNGTDTAGALVAGLGGAHVGSLQTRGAEDASNRDTLLTTQAVRNIRANLFPTNDRLASDDVQSTFLKLLNLKYDSDIGQDCVPFFTLAGDNVGYGPSVGPLPECPAATSFLDHLLANLEKTAVYPPNLQQPDNRFTTKDGLSLSTVFSDLLGEDFVLMIRTPQQK
jgi:hypothetical protein